MFTDEMIVLKTAIRFFNTLFRIIDSCILLGKNTFQDTSLWIAEISSTFSDTILTLSNNATLQ